ncbi:Beta-lactamase domain-containing protein [Desulfonema limicola]|uniref:Beta-lactamase domain-containing protein n=1 Tax=Desulfonema limicola TaxID=45656 RepID=A0A975BAF1_9BACT|nr:MBL fold metallo-hydrolase [Desulfonema limicola]QTA81738.1 Beta-lactamase domain-containing protein [Desulfonema limicola]
MRPSYYPRLINNPFDDPGIIVPFSFENRSMLFDIGDITSLSARDILKISHVFISHTHMDHFAGFDRLLRLFLGRDKEIFLYGPPGFIKNVEGKLAAYSWNLVKNYQNRFSLNVAEVHPASLVSRRYYCHKSFKPDKAVIHQYFNNIILHEPELSVSAVSLDHGIPCLGFSLKERFHVNIQKNRIEELNLKPGIWINRFKQAIYNNDDLNSDFEIIQAGEGKNRKFNLGKLAEQIALITPGQKITYITDAAYTISNIKKIICLAKDSDFLFIEAAFLDKDKDTAFNKLHLTARQAGTLAGQANVKKFIIFHFSPRYSGMEEQIYMEAVNAYELVKKENNIQA